MKLIKMILVMCFLPAVALADTTVTNYYFAEEVVKSPDGVKLFSSVRVVMRQEDLSKKEIKEVFTYSAMGEIKELEFTMHVDGHKMKLATKQGLLTGDGVLFGPPEKRNGWRANLKYADGRSIKFMDSVIDGDVYSSFNYFDANGELFGVSNSVYKQIEKESYELLRKQLLK